MLDQNTDRMWYVIGAVLIGAAIIFGMNTLMPNAFASVGDLMTDTLDDMSYQGPIDLSVDVGLKNAHGSIDFEVHADSEHGIESIEVVDGPAPVSQHQMLAFNGVDEYADIVHIYGDTQSFTIGGWFRNPENMSFITDHSGNGGWRLMDVGGIKAVNDGKYGSWEGADVYSDNYRTVKDMTGVNQTFHAVITWDGSTLDRYIDGQLVESHEVVGDFLLETKMIGTRVVSSTNVPNGFSSGLIGEFYVYGQDYMSESQVQNLYQNGVDAVSARLDAHYVFDSLSGDSIIDHSGNNRHGTNYGGRLVDLYSASENGEYTIRVTDNEGNVRDRVVRIRGL